MSIDKLYYRNKPLKCSIRIGGIYDIAYLTRHNIVICLKKNKYITLDPLQICSSRLAETHLRSLPIFRRQMDIIQENIWNRINTNNPFKTLFSNFLKNQIKSLFMSKDPIKNFFPPGNLFMIIEWLISIEGLLCKKIYSFISHSVCHNKGYCKDFYLVVLKFLDQQINRWVPLSLYRVL